MNWARLIKGFLLSFVFLISFAYLMSGVQYVFSDSNQNLNNKNLSASVSDAVNNVVVDNSSVDVIKPTLLPSPSASPLPKLEINSEAAISVETNLINPDKTLFQKSSQTKLPIASLTKLMTAVIILDNPSVYNFSDNVNIDSIAASQDGLKTDVQLGDNFSVENLFDTMLIESSNRCAYALSEKIGETNFVNLMNEKAKEIGLTDTHFVDPTGLSDQDVSTASDLSILAEYILKNYPQISDTTKIKDFNVPNLGSIKNSDELLGQIPEIVCSKTGFTNQAKGCLLLVVHNSQDNDYIINIILGAEDRFLEMKKLISNCN